jgi:hypothetical protein
MNATMLGKGSSHHRRAGATHVNAHVRRTLVRNSVAIGLGAFDTRILYS